MHSHFALLVADLYHEQLRVAYGLHRRGELVHGVRLYSAAPHGCNVAQTDSLRKQVSYIIDVWVIKSANVSSCTSCERGPSAHWRRRRP
jgi:hypothetical protein